MLLKLNFVQLVKKCLRREGLRALHLHGWSFPGSEDSFQHFTSVKLGVGSYVLDTGWLPWIRTLIFVVSVSFWKINLSIWF